MKILHLIYDHINNPWVGGGGAVRVYELYKRLSQNHEVTVVCGMYPNAVDYNEGNLKFHFVGTANKNYVLSTFCYAAKAISFLRKNSGKFDVVIEDFAPWNPVFSSFFSSNSAILHINHVEGFNILKRFFVVGIPFYFLEKYYPHTFSHVIALSSETKFKINTHVAAIFPAGLNSNIFSRHIMSGLDGQEELFVLYIGRLHMKNKGLDTLVLAMKNLDVKLTIIGKGPDERNIKEMIKDIKLHNIYFSGFVSDNEKMAEIEKSIMLVVPSRYEGQGIVVLEAAAFGKPVVVSDIPELRYAVDAGFGISFKTGDAVDLAKKVKYLLENEVVRNEMGQKGREYAKNFTWDKIAVDYEQYLAGVAGMGND